MNSLTINRALLSVSDKTHLVELAQELIKRGIEIVSTGGTAKVLKENNIPIIPIQEITGNPESFNGRMKTISFQIGSGILFRRNNQSDQEDAQKLGIKGIDLVVCNLYPFQQVSKNTDDLSELIENIDIGGPTMIRAAAKNFEYVACLTNPSQYAKLISQLDSKRQLPVRVSRDFSLEAFSLTASYDQYIYQTLRQKYDDNDNPPLAFGEMRKLRYGENPHQASWVCEFQNTNSKTISLANAEILQGKELSYNNMIDMDASWKCNSELSITFPKFSCVTIVKHGNPCGASVAKNQTDALKSAWSSDSTSAFGSIITFSEQVSIDSAEWLCDKFVEIIIAPSFSQDALDKFARKKNLRLVVLPNKKNSNEYVVRSINGGLLVQQEDEKQDYEFTSQTQTPFPNQLKQVALYGMIVNKYLKSNSILLAGHKNDHFYIAGAGMGQPNRLDSLKMLAAPRAINNKFEMKDLVLISDAFFPFKDSIEVAAQVGVRYIVQPGGSIRDKEVIEECNRHQIAMSFTEIRHFRH